MKTLRLLLFSLLAIAHLAVPAYLIARQKFALAHGRVFKLKTKPVDPEDAFRGRYVALRFDAETIGKTEPWKQGQRVFAYLKEGADGFATVERLTDQRPGDDENALPVVVGWQGVEFPFSRYYLEESLAPQAEEAYRKESRQEVREAWVTIRLYRGYAALEELYLQGRPIREYLHEPPSP